VAEPNRDSQFKRFRELARKLAAVPKREAEAQKAANKTKAART
jgi:hypothetical protein